MKNSVLSLYQINLVNQQFPVITWGKYEEEKMIPLVGNVLQAKISVPRLNGEYVETQDSPLRKDHDKVCLLIKEF